MRQPRKQCFKAVRIQIVDEMQLRRWTKRTNTRDAEPGKLRQSLTAEAGPAGAQNNDVCRPVCQLACGIADHLEVGVGFR